MSENATYEEIRSAYFNAIRHLHPDVNPDPIAKEESLIVQKAFEVLSGKDKSPSNGKQEP